MSDTSTEYTVSVSPSSEGGTLIRALQGKEELGSARLEDVTAGKELCRLQVATGYRGQGVARALLRAALRSTKEDVYIKPRPFGDMPLSVDALKGLYASEGFTGIDDKDNMVYSREKVKKAKAEGGFYKGKPTSPDTVKKTVNFQGLEIKVDRPKGFIMFGHDANGKPWRREYKYDYGFIPQTLGGDTDGLDVFIGPNTKSNDAYWVVQTKPDGSFDEYKVLVGFDDEAAARAAYAQHIPQKLLHEVSSMSIEMMKAMLGTHNPKEPIKEAMWAGFLDETINIQGYV